MIVGTAGHVDHGKTSLVQRLTGVDTARLKEEKARGITIDLGFAFMAGGDGERIGFVDVPGHERFVKTMVAGAAGVDHALLVIAADEGVMPQTREHLEILDLLGIGAGVIAITKCDRVDAARRHEVTRAIAEAVGGTALSTAPMIFVSARSGEGLAILRDHLVNAARERRPRDSEGLFRMAVDRVFSLKGIGTVATGTVLDGSVGVDDLVIVLPGSRKARVRSLHAQNRDAHAAFAGQRCALALHGPDIDRSTIARGAWICADDDSTETSRFDADVTLVAREKAPLDSGTRVHVHCGASHSCGRIVALEGSSLRPGTTGLAQITIDHALPLRHADRFVLRDAGARRTIGGGVVLDREPRGRERRQARLARLAALRSRDHRVALERLLDLDSGFVDLTAFARQRGLRAEHLEAVRNRLGLETLKVGRSLHGHRPERRIQLEVAVCAALAAFHVRHQDLPGQTGEELRRTGTPILAKPLFASLCAGMLSKRTIVAEGHWLRLPGFSRRVPEHEARLFAALRPLIGEAPFQPPRVRDMGAILGVEEGVVRGVCKSYAHGGQLAEIGRDRYFLSETVAEMLAVVRMLSVRDGRFHASAFRDRLGNGRKVAIEILEFFDRRGLTLRDGDWRHAAGASSLDGWPAPSIDACQPPMTAAADPGHISILEPPPPALVPR